MSRRDIEDVILELLAEDLGQDRDELRRALEEQGAQMPVDSLLAMEVLVRLEVLYGIEMPTNAETGLAMKSVGTYAQAVWDEVRRAGAAAGATGGAGAASGETA
jgi:acyl carrier protein